jgi:hypothetical protein
MGGSLSITISRDKGVFSDARQVDEDATAHMLMRLRPFILNDERTNFRKIKNILSRRAEHPPFRKHISEISDTFELKRIQFVKSFSALGAPPLTVENVMDWLNSYEHHRDKEKQQKASNALGVFGVVQNGKAAFLFSAVEMLRAILDLSDFIETLAECMRGNMIIRFPSAWVHELTLDRSHT